MGNERITVVRKPMIFISFFQADITIPTITRKMILRQEVLQLNKPMELYHNGRLIKRTSIGIQEGDILQLHTIRLEVYKEYILIAAHKSEYQTSLKEIQIQTRTSTTFHQYYRSPRRIQTIDDQAIEIKEPPAKETTPIKGVLATFIPTGVSVLISIGLGLVMGRGMFLLMSIASSTVTLITNGIKYIHDRKNQQLQNRERIQVYDTYLLDIRKQIYQKVVYNQKVVSYKYPDVDVIQRMLATYHHRIYERTMQDEDFLEVKMGYFIGESMFSIRYRQDTWDLKKDILKEKAYQLQQEYSNGYQIPLCIQLQKGHMGLVGNPKIVYQQLQEFIMNITFFHSYHDLKIVGLFHPAMKQTFSYMKWYPHVQDKELHRTTIMYEEHTYQQVLGNIYHLLKERQDTILKCHYKVQFVPHILCIITDIEAIREHPIMEFLQMDRRDLGYSIVYVAEASTQLPENIKTIIRYVDKQQALLVMKEGEYRKQTFRIPAIKNIDFEQAARQLAGIQHREKKRLQIPQQISFLTMYGIEKIEQFPLLQTWQNSKIYNSMAVPIGMCSKDTPLYLDIHEQAHGPHGLIAGTTGSGKSEMIQSYILSLAMHFHPHDIGFLLLDYKGGGMANLFKDLPHVLGIITNLEGNESLRALLSIQSELHRRQRIFKDIEINSITAYTKLFKSKKVKEPLPHILIICDEFAELKKAQPTFMEGLISIARIGRSLGIHLLLATQKPSGVVDDQIWSNAKFKICLKVQNEADSKEMLKTSDAARITQIGRGYLQVGNNEIYEIFQSAYSGEDYVKKPRTKKTGVHIYDEIGKSYLITRNQQEIPTKKEGETQLEAIVSYLHKRYQKIKTVTVKKPWLPPLPKKLVLPIHSQKEGLDLSCEIAQIDIPEQQTQSIYTLDLQTEGHIAYFAATGYGKTMFLSTIMISLARKNKVSQVHFYILDFGSHALSLFNQLGHTAEYITFDDEERFQKLVSLLQKEMKRRKRLFSKQQIQNFTLYNQLGNEKLPSMILLIDQFDVMKEKGIEAEMFFSKLARDGLSLGIYLIITATHQTDIRYATIYQIKNKIVGYVFDPSEVTQIMGRSEWKIPDSKGRIVIKTDTIHLAQMFLPVQYKEEKEYGEAICKVIADINHKNKGSHIQRMAVLPKQVSYQELLFYEKKEIDDFILGLDYESVKVIGHTLMNEPFLIIGPSRSGKSNALKIIYNQIPGQKYIFDTFKMALNQIKDLSDTLYASEEDGYHKILHVLQKEMQYRKERWHQATQTRTTLLPQKFYQELPSCTCFIEDIDYFYEIFMAIPDMHKILLQMVACGIHFIVCEDSTKASPMHLIAQVFKRTSQGLVLGSCSFSNPFQITMQQVPSFGNAVVCQGQKRIHIKMARFDED